ncbi:MAG TPA: PHB depolymerase family esterase [Verrucomicrobiae bacterium]|nr:PHB depolymerase family esterase [Verrucomicrobiae bacterium]
MKVDQFFIGSSVGFAAAGFFLHVIGAGAQSVAPSITTQPADRAIALGSPVIFSVTAAGTAPLSYQWRKEGINVTGATGQSLNIVNAQLTNIAGYTVLITNSGGAVTSRVAQLSVAEGRTYTNAAGERLPYRLFSPDRYDPTQRYPLVIYWAGDGGAGTDNLAQLSDAGQFVFLSATNRAKYPCFYVAPQMRTTSADCTINLAIIDQGAELVNLLKTEFSIDADRVYVTGLSHGGYYAWIFPARFPDLFAAAVPLSGGWLCHTNFLNIGVPVWNFHAANDGVVAVGNSDSAIAALRNAGGNPIYSRYPSGGHVTSFWVQAYNTPTLVDWVMAQIRGQGSSSPPFVMVTTPATNASFVVTDTTMNLGGAAAHYSNVLTVAWTNLANRTGGTAAGTNVWSVSAIPLRLNATNTIIVTGTATSGTPGLSSVGDTTFNQTLRIVQTAFRITNVLRDAGGVSFTWKVQAARTYRVQYKGNLSDADWVDLPEAPMITNSTASIRDTVGSNAQRFYRVIQLE